MYAVISAGGKQYKVAEGDKVKFEKLDGAVGEEVTFGEVLMVGTESSPKIGTPFVEGAIVAGKILVQDRAKKVIVYKKKKRKGYEKRYGHRQPYTEVKITKINVS
jgi:large subunit ribosomal protein L21